MCKGSFTLSDCHCECESDVTNCRFFTAQQRSCGEVTFSLMSVILSIGVGGSFQGVGVPGPRSLLEGGVGMPGPMFFLEGGVGMPSPKYPPEVGLVCLVPSPFWRVVGMPGPRSFQGVYLEGTEGTPPLEGTPSVVTSSGGHRSRQYASYWNVFLLNGCFIHFCYIATQTILSM